MGDIVVLLDKDVIEESISLAGARLINNYYKFEYIRSACQKTGSKVSYVIQKVDSRIIPTGAHKKIISGIRNIKSLSTTLKKPFPTVKSENEITVEAKLRADILCSTIYQIVNAIPKFAFSDPKLGHAEIAVIDEFFGLHNDKYTSEHIENVLRALNPDMLRTTHFSLIFKYFKTKEFSSIKYHFINDKIFYSSWLDAIKHHLAITPIGQSEYFEKFRTTFMDPNHPSDPSDGASFSKINGYEDDFVIDDSKNIDDIELRKRVNEALLFAIGYPALIALKSGLMTFSKTPGGEFNIHLLTHSGNVLIKFLNKMHISLPTSSEIPLLIGDQSLSTRDLFADKFLGLLLLGYFECVNARVIEGSTVSVRHSVLNNLVPSTSVLLSTLFNNLRSSSDLNIIPTIRGTTIKNQFNRYNIVIKNLFKTSFYDKYSSYSTQNMLFIKGRQVLKAKIEQIISDQINLIPLSDIDSVRWFKSEIDVMVSIARSINDPISRNELINIKKKQIIEYLIKIYTWRLLFPTAEPNARNPKLIGDIAKKFQKLVSDKSISQIEIPFNHPSLHSMNQFFKEFELNLDISYFSKRDILAIMPTIFYKWEHLDAGRSKTQYIGLDKVNSIRNIKALLPELKEHFDDTYNLFLKYFSDYIEFEGANRFKVQFVLETLKGSVLLNLF